MMMWSAKERAFAMEQYFKLGESIIAVRRAFKVNLNLKRHEEPPSHKTILAWVRKFRETAKATTQIKHGCPGRKETSKRCVQLCRKVRADQLVDTHRR